MSGFYLYEFQSSSVEDLYVVDDDDNEDDFYRAAWNADAV